MMHTQLGPEGLGDGTDTLHPFLKVTRCGKRAGGRWRSAARAAATTLSLIHI